MTKSRSAYSTPSKLGKLDTHIFVIWVDNEAGVLARVVGLFSGRGYNIESLAVAENKPTTLASTPASLSTQITKMWVSNFPSLLGVLYADLDLVI
jgi:hypothetical protein